jgi:hypothetical protein
MPTLLKIGNSQWINVSCIREVMVDEKGNYWLYLSGTGDQGRIPVRSKEQFISFLQQHEWHPSSLERPCPSPDLIAK